MSRTYSIGCKQCKESLWIGQGWPRTKVYIYKNEVHVKALEKFLFTHENHELVFVDDEDIFGSDGKEYEAEEYLELINEQCKS